LLNNRKDASLISDKKSKRLYMLSLFKLDIMMS
jgi:hypothetical protein